LVDHLKQKYIQDYKSFHFVIMTLIHLI